MSDCSGSKRASVSMGTPVECCAESGDRCVEPVEIVGCMPTNCRAAAPELDAEEEVRVGLEPDRCIDSTHQRIDSVAHCSLLFRTKDKRGVHRHHPSVGYRFTQCLTCVAGVGQMMQTHFDHRVLKPGSGKIGQGLSAQCDHLMAGSAPKFALEVSLLGL